MLCCERNRSSSYLQSIIKYHLTATRFTNQYHRRPPCIILNVLKKDWFEKTTLFMGILGQTCPYVQAYKIFSLKSAYAASLSSQLISPLSATCWILYGYSRNVRHNYIQYCRCVRCAPGVIRHVDI